jgi:hypothetical protein
MRIRNIKLIVLFLYLRMQASRRFHDCEIHAIPQSLRVPTEYHSFGFFTISFVSSIVVVCPAKNKRCVTMHGSKRRIWPTYRVYCQCRELCPHIPTFRVDLKSGTTQQELSSSILLRTSSPVIEDRDNCHVWLYRNQTYLLVCVFMVLTSTTMKYIHTVVADKQQYCR